MANHGYCKNCWWQKWGKCYFNMKRVSANDYCPDYANRKNCKDNLDDWIKDNNIEVTLYDVEITL